MDLGELMRSMGMSPFTYVNVAGMCAVTRLVQLRTQGVNGIPVEEKILKEADNVAAGRPVKNSSILSPDEEWLLWGQAVNAMGRQCAKSQTTFKVILFEWWVAEGQQIFIEPPCPCCGLAPDIGNLVFVDYTTKRYIVVQCDYGERKPRELKNHARRMAHVLFCVAKYIGYGPEFVRYCVYTKGDKELPEGITDPKSTPPYSRLWGEINQSNSKPALKPRDLTLIDIVLAKDDMVVRRAEKNRKEQGLDNMQKLRSQVAVSSDDDPGAPSINFEELEGKDDPETCADYAEHLRRRKLSIAQKEGIDPHFKPNAARSDRGTESSSKAKQNAAGSTVSKQDQGANGNSGVSSSSVSSAPSSSDKAGPRCASCKRTAQEACLPKLMLCGACRAVQYCSRDCQKADYKSHKLVCTPK